MTEESWAEGHSADEAPADEAPAEDALAEDPRAEDALAEDPRAEDSLADAPDVGDADSEPEPSVSPVATERTGHPAVDEVLGSIETLDDIPVAEQVAVFEAAHEKLRAALADAGNEPDA